MMKKTTLLMLVLTGMLCFFVLFAQRTEKSQAAVQSLKWHRYDEAFKLAKKNQKYVLVDFMAVWCGYCTLMQKTTYKDPKVFALLNKNFVLARVDIESEKAIKFKGEAITEADLSMYYEVSGTPTTWFFDSRGNAITLLPGYIKAEPFHVFLKYIAGGYYKKMMFNEYVKKHLPK